LEELEAKLAKALREYVEVQAQLEAKTDLVKEMKQAYQKLECVAE
jgi:cell division FtsZ-interacting protein ZapD